MKQGKWLLVFLALYMVPLLFESTVLEPTGVPRFALVSIFILLALITSLYKGIALETPKFPILISLTLFYLINITSSFWSFNPADSLYESQRVFLAIILVIVFLSFINSEEEEVLVIKSIIVSAFIYVGYALIQIIYLPDFGNDFLYQITSFSAHKNLLSSFLFLLLPFVLYGIILLTGQWKLISKLLFFLIILLLLFLQTRAVYLALIVTFFIFIFLFFRKKGNIIKICFITFLSLGIIIVLFSLLSDSFLSRIHVLNYLTSESAQERIAVWKNTILLIKEYPLFGVGSANWQYNFSKYPIGMIDNIANSSVSFQRPHNDFLWILSETGIMGFSFIVFILFYIYRKSRTFLVSSISTPEHTKIKIFFSFLCGLLVISFFGFEKERITHIAISSLLLGFLIRNIKITYTLKKQKKNALIFIAGGCIILNLIISFYRIKGEYFTRLIYDNLNGDTPELIISYGKKAISPFYLADPTSTPVYSYMGSAYNQLQDFQKTLEYSQKAYDLAPYDFKVLSNYGYILERHNQREKAELMLLEALRINPFYEQAIVNMVVLKYNQADYHSALAYLSKLDRNNSNRKFYEEKVKMKINQITKVISN